MFTLVKSDTQSDVYDSHQAELKQPIIFLSSLIIPLLYESGLVPLPLQNKQTMGAHCIEQVKAKPNLSQLPV